MDQTLIDRTNKLKLYLCCKNLSAAEFARSIGYTPQIITKYMSGRKKLTKKAARVIEAATKGAVTMEELLRFNPIDEKYMLEHKPLIAV